MLQSIAAFTVSVADPDRVAAAWCEHLGYEQRSVGHVGPELAAAWGADRVASRRMVVIGVAGLSEPLLRFVAMDVATPQPALLRTQGWNAIEILCADPYLLAQKLQGSPFEVVIAPRPIPWNAAIHAMQVLGPGGELLYLTQLPAAPTLLDLSPARRLVDRPFIAVLGGASLPAMERFYREELGSPTLPASRTRVAIINRCHGLPTEHRIPVGIVKMPCDYLFELDEMPQGTGLRVCPNHDLPPGIAMVSCRTSAARVGVVHGAASEWLELLPSRPI
jgi:hypothetical protein